ncbi:MAG TPA: hypothetical protein VHQ47_07175 [Phycisphaerae bacterium]|nr:hypothetical protein [Phycisphaerae bacterium]
MRMQVAAGMVLCLGLGLSTSLGASVDPADQKFFEQHINEVVKVQAEPLDNPAIGKVMAGKFFNLKLTVGGGAESVVAARLGDKVVTVALPDTTAPMPHFKELVKPDFKLQTDASAHALEDVFDVLYPVDADGAKVKTIRHAGTTWTFIRGKFFDHFEALIVTTDGKGAITGVSRSLEVK